MNTLALANMPTPPCTGPHIWTGAERLWRAANIWHPITQGTAHGRRTSSRDGSEPATHSRKVL